MEKIFSHRLLKGYIDFLDARFGTATTDEVLSRIGLDRTTLSDQNGFATEAVSHSLTMASTELTGEKNLSYLVGKNIANSVGILGGFVVGVTSPAMFMKTMGAIEGRLALKTITHTTRISKNKFRVDVTYKDGFKPKAYVCENRIGSYEGAPLFFGLPYAKVEHPRCMHRNEGDCLYFVQFPEHGFLIFKRISLALSLAALITFIGWMFNLRSPILLLVSGALVTGASVLYSIYKSLSAKKSLEWSLLVSESMVEQNRLLDAMYTRLASLQRLTTAVSECTDAEACCEKVVQSIVNDFRFGSSQLWLLDGASDYLSCKHAVGYAPEIQNMIMNTRFTYKENWDNPHGLLFQTLEGKKTIIVNDMQEILPRVAEKTRDFLIALKMSSFIMTPLINGDRVLGILASENHRTEKIQNQDKLVFQFISELLTNALLKPRPLAE